MKLLPVIFLLALTSATSALDNGLMRTPPMGWMSWERFCCNIDCENDPKNCISENLFRDTWQTDLAEDGWKEMGYDHVMIDDYWSSLLRDKDGRLQPDQQRFPGGIAKLARYLHDRGLKLGYPGTTLDKIETDAQTSASWGVDFRELDGCYSNEEEQQKGYPLMSKALNATGRPIGYSLPCQKQIKVYVNVFVLLTNTHGVSFFLQVNYTLLGEICNIWRNYDDTQDSWDIVQDITDWFFDNQEILQPEAGPGRWNDPDMVCPLGLSATTEFTVSTNPSGVVMWYVYPKMYYEHPQDDGRYPYIRQKYRMFSSLDFHKPRVVPPSLL
uniref:Alpha-galactosidase n=1 Tax=Oncorhynchus tshawytscha TaxID=74940 RepID=A0A8C8CIP9_ONCTS